MKDIINNKVTSARNSPPNIESGILNMGSPCNTRFEGSASAYEAIKRA